MSLFRITQNFKKLCRFKKPNSNLKSKTRLIQESNYWTLTLGILGSVFGLVFLSVPLYRMYCRKVGLDGNLEQKDYSQMSKKTNINKSRKIQVIFESSADPDMNWYFEPQQKEVFVHVGETALMFYKAINKSDKPIIGMAVYEVYPEFATNYFSKIQCFCFNQQLIHPNEELDLPLYFYIEPEYQDDWRLSDIDYLRIHYKFFACKKQDIAKIIHEQNIKETKQKIFLYQKRLQKDIEESDRKELQRNLQINENLLQKLNQHSDEEKQKSLLETKSNVTK